MSFFERFRKLNSRRRRTYNRIISVLSAIVVFIATYALVLPALTIDEETAAAEPGLEVSYINEEDTVLETTSVENEAAAPEELSEEEPTVEEPAAPEDSAAETEVTAVYANEEEYLAANFPARRFEAKIEGNAQRLIIPGTETDPAADPLLSLKDRELTSRAEEAAKNNTEPYTEDIFNALYVTVDADAGTFPKDVAMVLEPVRDEDTLAALETAADGEVIFIKAFNFAFYDAENNLIDPAIPIRLTMNDSATLDAEYNTIARINKQGIVEIVSQIDPVQYNLAQEEVATYIDMTGVYAVVGSRTPDAETVEGSEVTEDESDAVPEDAEESVNAAEDAAAIAEEQAEETDNGSVIVMQYPEETHTLTAEDGSYEITVTYGADAGIPENAELVVAEILPEDNGYEDYYNDALEMSNRQAVEYARFFDIEIRSGGEKIEPASEVQVVIKLRDVPETASDRPSVVHFGEEGAEVVELYTPEADAAGGVVEEAADAAEDTAVEEIAFSTDGFSVYGVVYTQIKSYYLSDRGELFEVTVSYESGARIPDNARLEVKEFSADSSEYTEAKQKVLNDSEEDDTQAVDGSVGSASGDIHFQAFDVTIYDQEGNEIEPQAPVHVSITLQYAASEEERQGILDTLEIHHLVTKNEETVVEDVLPVSADDQQRDIVINDESVRMNFVTSSFSTYTINWNTVYYGNITVQFNYVDEDGNQVNGKTGSESIYHYYGDENYNMAEYAPVIEGYDYIGARYNNISFSTLRLTPNTNWYYNNGWTSNNSYYNRVFFLQNDVPVYTESYNLYTNQTVRVDLVYRKKNPKKVHYGYIENGTFKEWETELIEDIGTPDYVGGQYNVRKEFSGKDYVTTRLNDPVNGTQISPLLQTEADSAAYWKYRIQDTVTVNGGINEWQQFGSNDNDIYVIYRDTPTNKSYDDGNLSPSDLEAPAATKTFENNKDGTYDLVLGVTGKSNQAQQKTHANVVIVLDTSSSMDFTYAESGNTRTELGYTRLSAAQSAICNLADQLFALNSTEDPAAIELAFVNFSHRVRNELTMQTIYSGTDASAFKSMINATNGNGGTNYDTAIEAANSILWNDADPTYVVFVTDGDTVSRGYLKYDDSGDGSDHAGDWDSGTYYDHDKSKYGTTYLERAREAAKIQVNKVIASGKQFYSIGVFGNVNYLEEMGGNYLGQADNKEAIEKAFSKIISQIEMDLGYQDVVINDGLTALTSTTVEHGAAGNFTYYQSGGTKTDGTEKYNSTANNGRGESWDLTGTDKEAFFLEIKDADTFYKNGSAWTDLTSEQKAAYVEKYGIGSRTVVWDLGSDLLEDGVTYKVAFTIWPSQEAYDLVANLNNKTVKFDDLDDSVKAQIVEDNGVYYVRTNTAATVDYTSVRTENGTVTETKTGSAIIKDPEGKMNLDTNIMTVRKEFAHLINEADPYEEIVFYLLVDGKYYNKDGTLSETLDESKVYAINLPKDNKWEDQIYIAPGLMRDGDILETGHRYSLVEKIVSGNPYEYEFAPQTVRPMVIGAVPTFLVLKDDYNTNEDNLQEYTFNDDHTPYGAYTVVNGKSDAANTYYAASENDGSLVGVNHKTSELDITKIVSDPNNLLTDAEEASETFTYRVTLQIPDGCDPSGIVGYEYVPRTQSNAFTLFGYQTGQSAFEDDIERFSGKTFRAWNTLVYRDLIEWENVDGRIVAKTDENGDIIWKVPGAGGYHTVIYDMTLKQDEVIRFTNLPTGTKYTIQEIYANKYPADNAGGKTDGRTPVSDASNLEAEGYEIERVQHTGGELSADKSAVEGEIESPDTRYYNQFTNKKVKENNTTRAELKVKKEVEDYTWGSEYYRFTLSAGEAQYTDTEGGTGTSPMPDGEENSVVSIYDSTADHTLSFGNIRYTRPGVYTYTVKEYDNTKNMPYVEFASPVTITVTVTADSNGKLSVTDIAGDQGTTVYSAAADNALAAGITTQTNTAKKINIRKADKTDTDTQLSGAVFEILTGGTRMYLQDDKLLTADAVEEIIGMAVSADGAEQAMKNAGIRSTFTIGEISIRGFSYDTVYELKEISAPDGYIITESSVYFKAVHEGTQVYLRMTDQSGNLLTDDDENPILDNDNAAVSENGLAISVKNEPGAELPHTGGPGTTLFRVLGALLAAGAGMLFMLKKRRSCEEHCKYGLF